MLFPCLLERENQIESHLVQYNSQGNDMLERKVMQPHHYQDSEHLL